MKYVIINIVIVLFSTCSINSQSNEIIKNENILEIDMSNFEKYKPTPNLILSVDYVPLETKSNCLIGEISKLIYHDEKIFVGDFRYSNAIFIFNKTGQYINKIDRLGKGPGEYIYLSDFDVNNNNIYIYAVNKILIYSFKGELIKELPIDIKALGFSVTSSEEFVFYKYIKNKNISYNVVTYNYKTKIMNKYFANRGNLDNRNIPHFSRALFKSNNNIYFGNSFSNYIYRFFPDGKVKEYLRLTNIESLLPSNKDIEKLLNTDINYSKGIEFNKFKGFKSFYENNDTMYFSIDYNNKIYCYRYLKDSFKLDLFEFNEPDLYFSLDYFSIWNEGFISYIPSYRFSKDNLNFIIKNSNSQRIKSTFLNLNSQSNPVIAFIRVNNN